MKKTSASNDRVITALKTAVDTLKKVKVKASSKEFRVFYTPVNDSTAGAWVDLSSASDGDAVAEALAVVTDKFPDVEEFMIADAEPIRVDEFASTDDLAAIALAVSEHGADVVQAVMDAGYDASQLADAISNMTVYGSVDEFLDESIIPMLMEDKSKMSFYLDREKIEQDFVDLDNGTVLADGTVIFIR